LARDGRKTCKARGLSGFEGSKFGHFNQQSEGGDPRDARNARQDGEAFGELRIGFDEGENGRVDGGDLTLIWSRRCTFCRFNSANVRILARFLAAVRSLTRASRAI